MDFESLRAGATIREWQFESKLPLVGGVVSWLRRAIHGIAGRWAVRAVAQQQSEFNHRLLDQLERWHISRLVNLETQQIASDRALLQLRRDLATWRIQLSRELAALDERLSEAGTTARGEAAEAVTRRQRQLEVEENGGEQMPVAGAPRPGLRELANRLLSLQQEIADLRARDEDVFKLLAAARAERRASALLPASSANDDGGQPPAGAAPADSGFDYFLFELRYRGSTDEIRRRQEKYLEFFQGGAEVLDLGCGRGEFLQLLQQRGIPARGVDLDPDMVDYCRQHGLPVERADLIEYLAGVEDGSLGGIFLGQVVEHLPPPVLTRLVNLAYQKLRPDACFVAETINPTCLLALTTHYLMDLSHAQPVHPEVLRFLLQSAGFSEITVHFASPVPDAARLKRFPATDTLSPTDQLWLPLLNENIDRLNDFLYGYQDYAIVGRKFTWPERLAAPPARRSLLDEA